MTLTITILAAIVAAILGYNAGRRNGRTVGQDEGRLDCELNHLAAEYERNYASRNKLGQFKGKEAQS